MPYGYTGKILHVDLIQEKLEVEQPPEDFYRKYLGGSAMGLYYILKETPPGLDALDPRSLLVLFTGVTTGAPISGQSRLNANAKSPLTGAIGDSQSGGFFPAELKFAGYDGIVVRGKASRRVYLKIFNGEASLHDASHLAGKPTAEVEALLRSELGDPKAEVLQHGTAADHGVLFSSLLSMSNRNNGRTGLGLVMASKNLQAIVVRGKMPVSVADPAALAALSKRGPKMLPGNPDVLGLKDHGTASVLLPQNLYGTLPTRNYQSGQFEYAEEISGERMTETILKESATCYACIVRCKRVVELTGGRFHADPVYGGPEYETLATFGSYCGVSDLAAIAEANQICNSTGMDTISAGATIAFAMECFEDGIIGLDETGGLALRFGDAGAMIAALKLIAEAAPPLGSLLALGSAKAAEQWGAAAKKLLITVKGQEAPAHMPQAKKSLAVIYAANPFGADHQSSEHDWMYEEGMNTPLYLKRLAEIGLVNPPPSGSFETEKVKFAVLTQHFYSLLDSLELCQFVWGPGWTLYGPSETAELLRAVSGWDVTVAELMQVGKRRLNMLRLFNAREGIRSPPGCAAGALLRPAGGGGSDRRGGSGPGSVRSCNGDVLLAKRLG